MMLTLCTGTSKKQPIKGGFICSSDVDIRTHAKAKASPFEHGTGFMFLSHHGSSIASNCVSGNCQLGANPNEWNPGSAGCSVALRNDHSHGRTTNAAVANACNGMWRGCVIRIIHYCALIAMRMACSFGEGVTSR